MSILFLALIGLPGVTGSPAEAALDAGDCTLCHGTMISDFQAPEMARTTQCAVCHAKAWHAQWLDPATGKMAASIYVDGIGYFRTADTVNSDAYILHEDHDGNNPYSGRSDCSYCHGVASCASCHTSVGHKPHSSTAYVPPTFKQADGKTNSLTASSCALSQCHQKMPDVLRTNPDGTELCVNCHPRFCATAADTGGHDAVLAEQVHNTVLPGALTFSTGVQEVSCAGCHDANLAAEHSSRSQDCTVCHSNTSYPNVLSVVKNANGVEASRSCDRCHFNSSVLPTPPEHSLFHIATQSGGLRVDGAPHENCNTCHQRSTPITMKVGSSDLSLSQVAAAAAKDYSCLSCHNGGTNPKAPVHQAGYNGQVHNLTVFHSCETCHDPNRTYISDPTRKPIDDVNAILAAGGEYSCTVCHTGTLAPNHQAELTVDANVTASVYEITQFHLDSTGAISCDKCHNNNSVLPTSTITALKTASGYKCASCHTGQLVPAHSAALTEANTAESTVGFHTDCQTCHNNTAVSSAIQSGQFRTAYLCTDCHNGSIAPQPNHLAKADADAQPANVSGTYHPDCKTCHGNPDYPAVNDIIKQTTANEETEYLCSKCHNSALGLEPKHLAGNLEAVTCSGCHNGTTVKGSFDIPVGTTVDVKGIHTGNSCNTCHTTASVQDFISAKAAETDAVYRCADCHDGTKAKTHNKQHTVTYYINGSADTSCAACHYNGDVTAIHSGTTNSGKTLNCDTCHGLSPKLPNTAAVITTNLSTNLSRTGFTCQDCHTEISSGHNHPVGSSGFDGNPNVDCSKCHATADDGSAELAAIHQQAAARGEIANYGCNTCHNSTFVGADKVIRSDGALDMKQNGGTAIFCTTCHNGTLADALGTKYPAHNGSHINSVGYGHYAGTWNGQTFDDSSADCSKCHASLVTSVVHDSAVHANVNCNSCHQSANPAVQGVISGAWSRAAVKASYTCADCHNSLPYLHQPDHVGTTADSSNLNCSGCHNAASWTGQNAEVVGLHKGNCNTCHASANSVVGAFITANAGRDNAAYACEACHVTGGAAAKGVAHQPEHMAKLETTGMSCSGCHTFNITAGTAVEIMSGTIHQGCNTCHGSTARADVKLFIASRIGQANAVYSCEDCHGIIHAGWEAKHAPTLPGTSEMNCADCHSNILQVEHLKALSAAPVSDPGTGSADTTATAGDVCAVCHSADVQQDVKDAIAAHNANCSACHNITHDPEHVAASTDSRIVCATCHVQSAWTQANADVAAVHNSQCSICHSSTNTVVAKYISDRVGLTNPVYSCEGCHTAGGAPAKEAIHKPEHLVNGNYSHFQFSSVNGYTDITGHRGGCSTCHGANVRSDVTAFILSRVGKANSPYDCSNCHNGTHGSGSGRGGYGGRW